MAEYPPTHFMVYGDSGSKKSTFAASFPKPILVFFFDTLGKDGPYLRSGLASEFLPGTGPFLTRDIYSREDGELSIRLEYFLDPEPTNPQAYPQFASRFSQLQSHLYGSKTLPAEPKWKTVVFDSVTMMELMARKHSQYKLDSNSKEPRRWFAHSTDQLEEALMISVGSLPVNVVTICHVDEDKDEVNGGYVRNPALPGRLRKHSSQAYSEFYHAFIGRDEKGKPVWGLQTQPNGLFNANSQILAPDGCPPDYEAVWANYGREPF